MKNVEIVHWEGSDFFDEYTGFTFSTDIEKVTCEVCLADFKSKNEPKVLEEKD